MRYRGFGAHLSARLDALTPERACLVQQVLVDRLCENVLARVDASTAV
ncbi:hypothetical protein [Saccharothrix longispora]|nr:hypothetical protein [Saccharothrix longispora]MBY8847487.1 hypothetical protein [Saccharothrix sp. MB29]MDU0289122.1 hypothetical protein [Saccharothrix longispora]